MKKLKKIAAYFVIFLFMIVVLAIMIFGILNKFNIETAGMMTLILFVSAMLLLWGIKHLNE